MYRILHLFPVAGSEILRDYHAGPAGQSEKKTDQDIHDRPHTADGGIGSVFSGLSEHPGIDHIVQLLEQIAGQQRQGKQYQIAKNAALGHITAAALPEPVHPSV